jgi:alkanesulfonate monooxygenase SsuD/methylene tetrahydromethanopterin reductase-like flavin-dependent oxidoreductase (luciferase family)
VGGHSRAALRRTVQVGAAWHPINRPPAELRAGMIELTRLSELHRRATAPTLTLRNDVRILKPGQPMPMSTHAGRVIAGEPTALVDQVGELARLGVTHLVLEFLSTDWRELDDQMTAFAERVRPQVSAKPS